MINSYAFILLDRKNDIYNNRIFFIIQIYNLIKFNQFISIYFILD